MGFDPLTLLTSAVIVLVAMGSLLVFLSLNEREAIALRWWGASFLVGAVGIVLVLSSPHAITRMREVASAIFLVAYGLIFIASQTFNRRPIFTPAVALGATFWLLFCWLCSPDVPTRVGVMSGFMACYCVANAAELWIGNLDRLKGMKVAASVLAIQALFYMSRSLLRPILFPGGHWPEPAASLWGAVLGVETLAFVFFFGFLVISMTRERTSQQHLKASLEDALTGIGNRRAFIQDSRALLERNGAKGLHAALILFDLDHFKTVNDIHGHDAGDRVLIEFARLARAKIPPGSVFCRIGGEEFGALLTGVDQSGARAIAETIRGRFADCTLSSRVGPIAATVSAGIAMTSLHDASLDALFSRADANLYRAKAEGRNRVDDRDQPLEEATLGQILQLEPQGLAALG